jgi:transposase InsO family protein
LDGDRVGAEHGSEVGVRRDQRGDRDVPLPILGIDSDNGSEFINWWLFHWCEQELRFTRSRSGNKNDGAHVEKKNWHIVRQTVG